jgi:hypothetical protein
MEIPDRYRFADLTDRESLVQEIAALETRLSEALGERVTLIAYTEQNRAVTDGGCRAGLQD